MPTLARLHAFIATTLSVAALAAPAIGATLTPTRFDDPTPDGCFPADCSLREAVVFANALPGPDVVVLAAGVYQLSRTGADENSGLTGDLDVTDDLELVGAGRTMTSILSFGLGDRLLHVVFVEFAARDLRLSGGAVSGIDGYGGGIYLGGNSSSTASLTRVDVTASSASEGGGGVAALGLGNLTLDDSSVTDSSVVGMYISDVAQLNVVNSSLSGNIGGGLHSASTAATTIRLVGSTVANNSGTTPDGGGGLSVRAFFDLARLEIADSTIHGNSSTTLAGGVLLLADAQASVIATLSRVTMSSNYSSGAGGAIATRLGINGPGTVELAVVDCDLVGNSAGAWGGAASIGLGVARFHGSSFSGNTASSWGGALFSGAFFGGVGSTVVTGSTFDDNSTNGPGGAIYADGGLEVSQSSFVANSAGGDGGGIWAAGNAFVTRSTFSGNQAAAGGGIWAGGELTLVYGSTFRDNIASVAGSALYGGASTFGHQLRYAGNLIAGTCAGNAFAHVTDGHNVESPGASCAPFGAATGDLLNVADAALALGPLTSDGRTWFHVPGAASAARDRQPTGCANADQRNWLAADASCDAGAIEVGAVDAIVFADGFELGLAPWSAVTDG